MRHVCDILEPPNTQGDYGEIIGHNDVYQRGVPCSIEHLSGREGEIARQTFGASTLRVKLYGDPRKPVKRKHLLKVGERLLHIADIKDVRQNGEEYELLCGEEDG